MIGETAPTRVLKVATSWLTPPGAGLITPGAAPPDQLVPVIQSPSPPRPVQVWLAAITPLDVIAATVAASVEVTMARRRRACRCFVRSIFDCIDALRYGLILEIYGAARENKLRRSPVFSDRKR